MKEPLITIITPSFNQSRFVEKTIQSVLNQTYKNIEYIIIDGYSTDGSIEILEKYRNNISSLVIEKDKGQADAINKGFKIAKGEIVGWINSDDVLYPDCVESIVKLYNQFPTGVIFYHSLNDRIDSEGNIFETYNVKISNKKYLLKTNYDIIQPGSFYLKNIVEKVGYLCIDKYYCMDLDLWLKLLDFGTIHYTEDKPHTAFRKWEMSKTSMGKIKFITDIQKVLFDNGARIYNRSILKSYWIAFRILFSKLLK